MPHMHPCPEILHLHHIQVSRHGPHLHPGPVRPASRSQDSHLASLHVASHFYMDLTAISVPRIAFPSRSHPTYIQVSRCVSPPNRSCLTSIQVPISTSHLHPGHISTPIQVKTIAYHFHPGPISPSAKTWYSCLISSQVSIFTSHHSVHISPPSTFRKLHLSFIQVPSHPIQVPRFLSHLHQGPISRPSISQNLHLTCTQVPRFSSHLSVTSPLLSSRQGSISPASRSHLTPSRFLNLCLASMQVTFHLHPGPDIRVTPPFRSHLGSIQVLIQVPRITSHLTQDRRLVFHLHPSTTSPAFESQDSCLTLTSFYVTSHLHSGPKNHASPLSMSLLTSSTFSTSFATHLHPGCVSPPFRTWFKCIKVPICTYPLHRCCVSPPSRSWEQHLTPPPGLRMCVSPESRSRLSSVQILIFVSHLYTGHISPPLRSWELHLSFIQVPSHPIPCLETCVSPLSISCLTSIQVTRATSLLHLGPVSPPSRSLDSYFTSNLLCPGLKNFISSPYRSHLTPMHISKRASYHYSGIVRPLSRWEDSCLTSIQVSPSRLCPTSM